MDAELKRHYTLIVDFLGHILGPDYEIALHELKDDSNEIIAIANGALTAAISAHHSATKCWSTWRAICTRRRTMC